MATINITSDNFESTITNNEIVIVDYWADWCGPCKSFGPTFEKVSEQAEFSDVVFAKVNTEEQQELAAHFQIRSIPTLMVFREQVVLFANPGALNESQLLELIGQIKEVDMKKVHAEIKEKEAQAK